MEGLRLYSAVGAVLEKADVDSNHSLVTQIPRENQHFLLSVQEVRDVWIPDLNIVCTVAEDEADQGPLGEDKWYCRNRQWNESGL